MLSEPGIDKRDGFMRIIYFLDIPRGLGGAGNVLLEQAKVLTF